MLKNMPRIAIAIGLIMVFMAFMADKAKKSDFDTAEELIVMRNIAHQVLRYTGDSISPIGPVTRISSNEFRIPFESSFSFKPDSLVNIIDKVIADNKLPSKYIVTVLEDKSDKVIYGYAVMGPQQTNIVPCLGRNLPAKPYHIDIRFEESKVYPVTGLYAGGIGILTVGLLILGVNGYKGRRYISEAKENETESIETALPTDKESETPAENTNIPVEKETEVLSTEKIAIPIGKYLFFADDQVLKFNEETTILTGKESKILSIFANAPNQIIDRKRLQKEIWEDEGVIVGRSLDMFISRLRKKLEKDPGVQIVNIHSKGYKLEIKISSNEQASQL
jgi:DNA-binding winged helix-turn-helix (wHTH) protein